MIKVTLQLDSHIGVDNFQNYKKDFLVNDVSDPLIKKYIAELDNIASHYNEKWEQDDIDDGLYIFATLNGKESRELEDLIDQFS